MRIHSLPIIFGGYNRIQPAKTIQYLGQGGANIWGVRVCGFDVLHHWTQQDLLHLVHDTVHVRFSRPVLVACGLHDFVDAVLQTGKSRQHGIHDAIQLTDGRGSGEAWIAGHLLTDVVPTFP